MPTKTRNSVMDQLELFRPPPSRPLWNDLPECVRAEVRELVAQMLRVHAAPDTGDEVGKEASDD